MGYSDVYSRFEAFAGPVPSYTVHFLPIRTGGFSAVVPALPNCIVQGDSLEDAEANAREAILIYLESLAKDGLPFPADRQAPVKRVSLAVETVGP